MLTTAVAGEIVSSRSAFEGRSQGRQRFDFCFHRRVFHAEIDRSTDCRGLSLDRDLDGEL